MQAIQIAQWIILTEDSGMKFIFNLDSNTTFFSGMVIVKLVTPNSSVFAFV